MTVDKEPYFLSNKEWFCYDEEEFCYKLTKEATTEAIKSYEEFYSLLNNYINIE